MHIYNFLILLGVLLGAGIFIIYLYILFGRGRNLQLHTRETVTVLPGHDDLVDRYITYKLSITINTLILTKRK